MSRLFYVHVPVKGKKDESPEPESVIKNGKGKRNCLLDGEKRCVHAKARVNSWGMEKSALFNMTLTLLNNPWRERKDSWRMD